MERDEGFRVELEVESGTARIRLLGELDMGSTDDLLSFVRTVPLDGGIPSLALDLEELSFVDSTGLRALLTIISESVARGHQVAVLRPRKSFLRIVELTGLATHFEPHLVAEGDGRLKT